MGITFNQDLGNFHSGVPRLWIGEASAVEDASFYFTKTLDTNRACSFTAGSYRVGVRRTYTYPRIYTDTVRAWLPESRRAIGHHIGTI